MSIFLVFRSIKTCPTNHKRSGFR